MLLEYIAIAVMIAVATLIAAIAIGLGELLGPKKASKVKEEAYESGIVPFGPGTRRMPVRFYLIAVVVARPQLFHVVAFLGGCSDKFYEAIIRAVAGRFATPARPRAPQTPEPPALAPEQ